MYPDENMEVINVFDLTPTEYTEIFPLFAPVKSLWELTVKNNNIYRQKRTAMERAHEIYIVNGGTLNWVKYTDANKEWRESQAVLVGVANDMNKAHDKFKEGVKKIVNIDWNDDHMFVFEENQSQILEVKVKPEGDEDAPL